TDALLSHQKKKKKTKTPAASTSGKVRMVIKKAATVLSMAPASLKSTKVSKCAEIRDIRRRLTKVERQAIDNA
ncbi:uncharacterized protein DAT39_019921, partial [Clarias magur]